MLRNLILTSCVFSLGLAPLCAETESKNKDAVADANVTAPVIPQPLKEEAVEAQHTIQVDGRPLSYKSTTGTMVLKDNQGKPRASIFYVAYTKENVTDVADRPVTYCFNGGPGSSSVWLHLGILGPRKLDINDEEFVAHPYNVIDNAQTVLDVTDLVFIDPVSTGHSKAAPGEDPKVFHHADEDVKSVAEFIRLYTTRNNRWGSPKFLAGESYGTLRAVALAGNLLQDQFMQIDGLILISTVLNFQTLLENEQNNDLPYLLFLPSYTATAWYHKKLPQSLQEKPLLASLTEAEHFTENEYCTALFKGDSIDGEERSSVIGELAKFTGLKPEYIEKSRLRIPMHRFAKEFLRDDQLNIGRFDSRYKGEEYDQCGSCSEYDPSSSAIIGSFTSAFNQYLRSDLKWEKDDRYNIVTNILSWWNFGPNAQNQYLSVTDTLRGTMLENPNMNVLMASGYYDLATPYYATIYTVNHMGLNPKQKERITMKFYEGGHMMYLNPKSLKALSDDITAFIQAKKK